jgi:biotin operon repressor
VSTFITETEYEYILTHVSEPATTIAAAIGRSPKAVSRQVQRINAGLPFEAVRNAKRVSNEVEAKARRLRDEGHSIPCIARAIRTSDKTVQRIIGYSPSYRTCGCLKAMGISSVKTHMRHAPYAAQAKARQATRIGKLNQGGATVREIMAQTKLSRIVVENRLDQFYAKHPELKRIVYKPEVSPVTPEMVARVVELLNAGHSQPQVRKMLKMSRAAVDRAVRLAKNAGDLPTVLSSSPLLARRNAIKVAAPVAITAPLWTEGRDRYLRVLRKQRTVLDFIPDELNREFPHLPRVSVVDVRDRLYGTAAA